MKFEVFKKVTKLICKSKKEIVKHAPQIMAAAGAACFIGATVCAIKETPKANKKLEEKKALDPDMSTLQKVAVAGPEYKGTIALTAAGVALNVCAWKVEADKVAKILTTSAGLYTAAIDSKKNYVEATKEVVGEEKAKEIEEEAKKKNGVIISSTGSELDADLLIPDRNRVVPCKFSVTKKTWYTTYEKIKDAMDDLIEQLQENGYISLSDITYRLYGEDCEINVGYIVERSDGYGYLEQDAEHRLRYKIDAWEDDFHRLGWYLDFAEEPVDLH